MKWQVFVASMMMAMLTAPVEPMAAPSYPDKPIRVVTGGVGGGSDISGRIIAAGLSARFEQQVIVDNRGAKAIPVIVARAAPDGYTLMYLGSSLWVSPLMEKSDYDPVRDFAPLSLTTRSPNVLVVNLALPVKSVKDLIALARAKAGALNYSGGNAGASPHLAAELFNSMAGVRIERIPFSSGAARMAALVSGDVHMEFAPAAVVQPYLQSGKLRAVAVTSREPSTLFPDLPAIAASGLPGYEYLTVSAMFAPARTPAAVTTRFGQELAAYLRTNEAKERLLATKAEAVSSTPAELLAMMMSEMARMGKVIKDAGIRLD